MAGTVQHMTVGLVHGWDSAAHDSGCSSWLGQCSTWQWVQFMAGSVRRMIVASVHEWESAAHDSGFSSWLGDEIRQGVQNSGHTWGVFTGQWRLYYYINHPGGSHHLMTMKDITGFCPLTWAMQQYAHILVLCANTNVVVLPRSAISSVTLNIIFNLLFVWTSSTNMYIYCKFYVLLTAPLDMFI